MADSKSAGRMDIWRNYFRGSNADIFETIEKAIMVAASDYPNEFRIRRDKIAQTLFSCNSIKCSGCDKLESLNVDRDKLESLNVDGNGSNKEISDYSYGVAEALEEKPRMFREVMRIKDIINNSRNESELVLYNSLGKLHLMDLSVETLKATEIGKSVNALRKHASKNVSEIARTLVWAWKDMVDRWVIATEKMSVPENTPESLNPSVLEEEEEEGLPSPPMEDLSFFYGHGTSLELSEFFDGMDECANPRFDEKLDSSTKPKKSQSSLVKPSKLNTERKSQTAPKRPLAPHQTKTRVSLVEEKFEAAKRKLQERYQEVENAKKQRTIQVMEVHHLPKNQSANNNRNRRR